MKKHNLSGKTVTVDLPIGLDKKTKQLVYSKVEVTIMDYWLNVKGTPWGTSRDPLCKEYAIRAGFCRLPPDDKVFLALSGEFAENKLLVHESEIERK